MLLLLPLTGVSDALFTLLQTVYTDSVAFLHLSAYVLLIGRPCASYAALDCRCRYLVLLVVPLSAVSTALFFKPLQVQDMNLPLLNLLMPAEREERRAPPWGEICPEEVQHKRKENRNRKGSRISSIRWQRERRRQQDRL